MYLEFILLVRTLLKMNSLIFASFSIMNLLLHEWLYGGGLV